VGVKRNEDIITMKFPIPDKLLTLRTDGRRLRDALEAELRTAKAGDVVEISFSNVEAITGSATDEFLGKLLTARSAGDVPDVAFVLTGLNEDTAFEVNMCLSQRKAAAVWSEGQHAELLGGDEFLKITFEHAARHGEFVATDLAAELEVTPQNLNNRLKRLVSDGALIRRRDTTASGKQFVYEVPQPA
jgi:hypothetical protein